MTWDLYTLDRYFRMWTERQSDVEALYVSNDKAFNELLAYAVTIQNTGKFTHFEKVLPKEEVDYIDQITNRPDDFFTRKAHSAGNSYQYRSLLINKFETLLGVTN